MTRASSLSRSIIHVLVATTLLLPSVNAEGFFANLGTTLDTSIQDVLSTPMNEWETRQWITALILVFVVFWCCGCVGNRRRRGRGGGGGGNCLANLLCCACCFELCCRDCQDLQPFLGGAAKLPTAPEEEAGEPHEYELQGDRMV